MMNRSDSIIYLDVLWEEVVAVWSVVEHNLIEGGCSQFYHVTVVVTAIFVFTDHLLAHYQLPHGSLVALSDRSSVLLVKAYLNFIYILTAQAKIGQ